MVYNLNGEQLQLSRGGPGRYLLCSQNPVHFSEERKITMKDLEDAAGEEVGKSSTRMGFRRQDSEAARMYN